MNSEGDPKGQITALKRLALLTASIKKSIMTGKTKKNLTGEHAPMRDITCLSPFVVFLGIPLYLNLFNKNFNNAISS